MNFAIFCGEVAGMASLVLLGLGTTANDTLKKKKGHGTRWVLIVYGWVFALFTSIFIAVASGHHLNPAVTLARTFSGKGEYAPGIEISALNFLTYIGAQIIGTFLGAVIMWLAYKKQFDQAQDSLAILNTFATTPEIRDYKWNIVSEAIATFVLVLLILNLSPSFGIWEIAVSSALLFTGARGSLGGPTGFATNPARDVGPRLAHWILPIKNKGSSDWSYAWVPIVGPLLGGFVAGIIHGAIPFVPLLP